MGDKVRAALVTLMFVVLGPHPHPHHLHRWAGESCRFLVTFVALCLFWNFVKGKDGFIFIASLILLYLCFLHSFIFTLNFVLTVPPFFFFLFSCLYFFSQHLCRLKATTTAIMHVFNQLTITVMQFTGLTITVAYWLTNAHSITDSVTYSLTH